MDKSNNSEVRSMNPVDSDSDLDDFDVLEKETFESIGQSPPQANNSHSQPTSYALIDDDIVNSLAAASVAEPTGSGCTERTDGSMIVSQNSAESDELALTFDLKRITEENLILRSEVESLNAKLREVGSQFEILGKKISQGQEDKKKLEQCNLKLAQLAKEHDELKIHIESSKKQIVDLENQLQAARHELEAQKLNESQFIRVEMVENQLRFKDEQLEHAKKQLAEIMELYQLEQNQTIDLKEKLRAAECKPISASMEHLQLFSFTAEDVSKIQQDLEDCKATLVRQNSDMLHKDEHIQILLAQLESAQMALNEERQLVEKKNKEYQSYVEQSAKEKEERLRQVEKYLLEQETCLQSMQAQLAEKENVNVSLLVQLKERQVGFQEMSLAKEKCDEICGKYQERIKVLSLELKELKQLLELQLQKEGEDHHLEALRNEVRTFKRAAHDLDRENTTLRTQNAALMTENDSISHWKAQCETYMNDYAQVLSQRDALDLQIAELNKAIEDLREEDKRKEGELQELHSTHIRFAQEHINSQEPPSIASSTTSAKGQGINGNEGEGKHEDIVSHVLNQLKRGVSLLWEGENEQAPSSTDSFNSNSQQPNPSAPASLDPQPSTSSRGATAVGCSTSDLPPCPVCGKIFYDYTNLVEHCENCGEGENIAVMSSPSPYGQHLDPFVFVPHQ